MYDELVKKLRSHNGWALNETLDEAADAIEELICEVADEHNARLDVEERHRWIPVTERLPDADGFTLIFTAHGNPGVCYFTSGWWGGYDKDGITHWMPLIQPQEEG